MKVVINNDYGGFSLSTKAMLRLRELGSEEAARTPIQDGETWSDGSPYTSYGQLSDESHFAFRDHEQRADPLLVQVVEELGNEAGGWLSSLKVVEIPDGIEWGIAEYDGWEHVEEVHRTWG